MKQAYEELKRSEKRFRLLCDLSPIGIFFADNEGKCTYVNDRCLEISGTGKDDSHGLWWILTLHPDDRKVIFDEWKKEKHRRKSFAREVRYIHRDGKERIGFIHAVPINGEGYLGTLEDITERKKLEHSKDEFISTVSHELRTPLTIIKEAIENLSDGLCGDLTGQQKDVVSIAQKNTKRLVTRALIDDIIAHLKAEMTDNRIALEVSVPQSIPDIYADSSMIMQVMSNILANAYRYAKSNITISAKPLHPRNMVEISIWNDGPHIDKKDHKRIFDKFYQINRQQGEGYKGTGLGLPISKRIIELHGGELWIISAKGKGVSFAFTIPQWKEVE
jgi:PAS domain S-box-containing protein